MHLRDRAVIGLLSLVLVGLTAAVVAPSLAPADPGETPSASDRVLRPYVEGVIGSAGTLSPFSAQSVVERTIASLLFRGLVRLGPDDRLIGDLAERWTVDDSGSAWTFHLRPGLSWHDGEPITSADVLFTVRALSDPNYQGPGAASWREVTATSADPLTVTLTLATPLGGFLQAATQHIAPEHLLGRIAPAELPAASFGQRPVGSGAFRLGSLDAEHAVLVPWVAGDVPDRSAAPGQSAPQATDSLASPSPSAPGGAPVPYLDGIVFRFFPNAAALEAAWSLGQLDGAGGLPAEAAARLTAGGDARIIRYPSTTLFAVTLNLRPTHPQFRDAGVRVALLQAIDRDAIVGSLLGGFATRADGLIPSTSWAFDSDATTAIAYDPEAATAALVAAGWKHAADGGWIPKGGKDPLTIEIISPLEEANPTAFGIAAAVAADWQAIGLTVTHVPLPGAEFVGDRLQVGEFDAAVTGTTIGLDPDLYPLLASTQAKRTGSNFSGLQDPTLDPLLVKARAPGSDEVRKAAYAALQVKLSAGTYVLPLAFGDLVVVVRNTLSGPLERPVGAPGDRFWDVLTWRLAEGR